MERVEKSILTSGIVMKRIIPNGVDLSVFKPAQDRLLVRKSLDLPVDAKIVMFAAYGIRKNIWKDYKTMKTAVNIVSETMKDRQLIFLAVGEKSKDERIGKAIIRFIPYQRDPNLLAQFYQAADLYIHAARADTFPNTVLESLACGTPVIATAVGGIPEQIIDGVTGWVTPPGDPSAMAARITELLNNEAFCANMSINALSDAESRFSLDQQINEFLSFYGEVIADWKLNATRRNSQTT
jgi:glycosyltransferase involved in cell wall biosynthesis